MDLNFQVSWECRFNWVVVRGGVVGVVVPDAVAAIVVVVDEMVFLGTIVTQGLDFGVNY